MKCEYCGKDSKCFVVIRITNDGPEMACRKCYDRMKRSRENETNEKKNS